jgi:ATP-dependent DNA helicase PIF1
MATNLTQTPFTEGQQRAFDAVCYERKNVFLTGPGGSGKSYLVSHIVADFEAKQKKVGITAMTGCAALLLHPKARTLHSFLGIGLGQDSVDKITARIKKTPQTKKRWLTIDLLILDEVSMLTPALLEKLDDVAQRIRRIKAPFGGLQVLLVGDFYQIPPVYTHADKQANPSLQTFAFESPVWNQIVQETIQLTQIKRQEDPIFQQILNEARVGQLSDQSYEILKARQIDTWKKQKIKPTLIFNRRAAVQEINQQKLEKLKGDGHTYAVQTVFGSTNEKENHSSEEQNYAIQKLDRDSTYEPTLTLKMGAQVMCLKNYPDSPLVNGSRGVVIGFGPAPTFYPLVEYLHGYKKEMEFHQWESEVIPGMYRQQIPLCLSWANTTHKLQGSTLDCAIIDIGQSTFEYGQAYVALSRVRSLEGLYIFDLDPKAIRAHPKVKAYYETLNT